MNCPDGSIPLISVVIPSKNRADFLLKAIESVLTQTFKNIEIIIVDDGSDEPVSSLIDQKFGSKVTCLRHEESKGAPAARNTGIKYAHGDYVAFLDDDDVWLPEKLERQLNVFAKNPTAGLVFCGEKIVCGKHIVKTRMGNWDADGPQKILLSNVVGGTSTVLIRSEFLDSHLFDEDLPSCQDWDLFVRLSQQHQFAVVADPLVIRAIHGAQISSALNKRILGREMFYAKHAELFETSPKAHSQMLRRLGSLFLLKGEDEKARRLFWRAFKVCPLALRSCVFLCVTNVLPPKMATKILTRYAVTSVGDYCQFH